MRDYRDRSDDDGPPPALTIACVIGSPCLGKWCEDYITWLRAREVGWASIANYTNSLYSLLTFVATSDEYELTYESGFTCFDMLANLRRQAHGHASTDKMYRKRDANWMVSGVNTHARIRSSKHKVIFVVFDSQHGHSDSDSTPFRLQEWPQVQETRMNAIEAYEATTGTAQRRKALVDVLVLCALTLLPPGSVTLPPNTPRRPRPYLTPRPNSDRVGVIRLLKHGYTLKWEADDPEGDAEAGSYYIDLTDRNARHKVALHTPTHVPRSSSAHHPC